MLHDINFLPWRSQLTINKSKRLLTVFVSLFGGSLILSLVVFTYLNQKIQGQLATLITLDEQHLIIETKRIEYQARLNDLSQIMKTLAELQEKQPERYINTVVMNVISRLLPQDIYVDSIKRLGNKITLVGVSTHSDAIKLLLERMNATRRVKNVYFNFIGSDTGEQHNHRRFSISFTLLSHGKGKGESDATG